MLGRGPEKLWVWDIRYFTVVPQAGEGRMKTDMNLATFLSVPVLDTFWHAYRLLSVHLTTPLTSSMLRASGWLNQGSGVSVVNSRIKRFAPVALNSVLQKAEVKCR